MVGNTISIHRATFSFSSRRHCSNDPADSEKHSDEGKSSSDRESDEKPRGNENSYAVDEIVRRVG